MMKNKKAISLAEVMIVVAIVAIVAIVFLAMPKKKVSKLDKAKYYAAYTMLKTMQDGKLAKDGDAGSNDFCGTARAWLNITTTGNNCQCIYTNAAGANVTVNNCVTLINGMNLYWTVNGTTDPRTVTVDLDGFGNGLDSALKDQHDFTLHSTPNDTLPLLVEPDRGVNAAGGLSDWIEFRVFRLQDNDAHKNYSNGEDCQVGSTCGTARTPYNTAIRIFSNCIRDYNGNCFMEAKKPY